MRQRQSWTRVWQVLRCTCARRRVHRSARSRLARLGPLATAPVATDDTRGRVVLFTTCYGNRNEPELAEDLAAVFAHNGIELKLAAKERCCGMPKLELGDLEQWQSWVRIPN
jgi:Fe-S oxidoreductase